MKNLEDRILKKVYVMETKKTSFSLLAKVVLFMMSGFVAFLFTQVLLEIFIEEKTFDLLEIFGDDWEVISKHMGDILFVVFQETPKFILAVAVLSGLVLLLVVLTFIRNFGMMKHKLAALFKYWKGQN